MDTEIDTTGRVPFEEAKRILSEAGQTCSSSSDHIGFVLIVEAHLNNAKRWDLHIQIQHLKVLLEVLKDHETLRKDAAWDIVKPVITFAFQDSEPSEGTPSIGLNSSSDGQKDLHAEAILLLDYLVEEGNPREVFITVTQLISTLSFEGPEQDFDEDTSEEDEDDDAEGYKSIPDALPKIEQASFLMSMLIKILQRIRAKKLSRFLTSCLIPLLGLVTRGSQQLSRIWFPTLIDHIETFLEGLWTYMISRKAEVVQNNPEEFAVQKKLLQAFQTHLVERFFLSQETSMQDIYGNWAAQFDNLIRPEKMKPQQPNIPKQNVTKTTAMAQWKDIPDTDIRKQKGRRMMNFIWNLECEPGELLRACLIDDTNTGELDSQDDDDTPEKSEEIPLAPIGSLLVLVEQQSIEGLIELKAPFSNFKIFPHHQQLMVKFLLHDNAAYPIIDAILYLGQRILAQYSFEQKALGNVSMEDDSFFLYLQKFAYIATTCDNPSLRYLANLHVANVLSIHPSKEFRLNYIKDTLEHCPFENLKAATITMLKDFIFSELSKSLSNEQYKDSLFLSPKLLDEVLLVLFPDYTKALSGKDIETSYNKFQEIVNTIQSTAGFVQAIYTNKALRQALELENLKYSDHIKNKWAYPILSTTRSNYLKAINNGKFTFVMSTEIPEIRLQIQLLEFGLESALKMVP